MGRGNSSKKTLVHFEVEEAFKELGPEMHDVWVDPGSFTSCYAEYHVGERYLVFAYDGALLPKDSPAVSVVPGESKTKPLPPGIDVKNPPKIYSAPEMLRNASNYVKDKRRYCSGSGLFEEVQGTDCTRTEAF